MDDGFAERAARRRATWQGGVARSWEELDQRGVEFWQAATPTERLDAMWQLLVDEWTIKGKHGPPPGFQGSIVGVGRFER